MHLLVTHILTFGLIEYRNESIYCLVNIFIAFMFPRIISDKINIYAFDNDKHSK